MLKGDPITSHGAGSLKASRKKQREKPQPNIPYKCPYVTPQVTYLMFTIFTKKLRADGFAPWLDEEALYLGQDWDSEIPKAVRSSDVVIVYLSQSSKTKTGYVQKKIRFALDVADIQPENAI